MPKTKATKPNPLFPEVSGDDLIFCRNVGSISPDPVQYKPYNPFINQLEGGTNLLVQLTCPMKWVAYYDVDTVVLKPKGLAFVGKQIATAIAWMHSNASITAETN